MDNVITRTPPLSLLFKQFLALSGERGRAFPDIPAFQNLEHDQHPVRVITKPKANAALVYVADEIVATVSFTAPLPGDLNYTTKPAPDDARTRIRFGYPGTDMSVVDIVSATGVHDLARQIASALAERLPAQVRA